jgi:hypothetical protein
MALEALQHQGKEMRVVLVLQQMVQMFLRLVAVAVLMLLVLMQQAE